MVKHVKQLQENENTVFKGHNHSLLGLISGTELPALNVVLNPTFNHTALDASHNVIQYGMGFFC